MSQRLPLLFLTLTSLLLLALSCSSHALEPIKQCASSRETPVEYLRCLDRRLAALEKDITLWGNNQLLTLEEKAKLTGHKDILSLFKKAQQSFVKYREHNCRWQYLTLLPDTTAGAIRYKECMVGMSQTRVEMLKKL